MKKVLDYFLTAFLAFGWVIGLMTNIRSVGFFDATGKTGIIVVFVIAVVSGVFIALKFRQLLWHSKFISGSSK